MYEVVRNTLKENSFAEALLILNMRRNEIEIKTRKN